MVTAGRLIGAALLLLLFREGAALAAPEAARLQESSRDTGVRVGRIDVRGNHAFSTSKVLGAMTLSKKRLFILPRAYDDLTLDDDLRRIADLYHSQGFVHAAVSADSVTRRGDVMDITIEIREETRLILRSTAVEGATGRVDARELAGLIRMTSGRPLDLGQVNEARARILRRLADAGHAFATLTQSLQEDGNEADLVFRVAAGPAVTLGSVRVSGHRTVETAAILREVRLPRGALIRRRDLARVHTDLARRDLYRSIAVAPRRPSDATGLPLPVSTLEADLSVAVEEKPPRWIAARAGYGSADRFHGGFEWGHRNLDGHGRRFTLEGSASATRINGAATLREPWPIASVSTGRLRISMTDEIRQAFTERKAAVLVGAEIPLGEWTVADLWMEGARTELRKYLPGSLREIQGDLTGENYQSITTAGSLERVTYDDRAFPRSGSHGRVRAEVMSLDLEAWKVEGSVGRAHAISDRVVAAGAVSAGLVRGFGRTSDVPSTIRFFLGGPESLRGFRKDEVGPVDAAGQATGGEFYVLAQGELRLHVTDQVHAAAFLDVGQSFRRATNLDLESLAASPGIGLRYHTPFGPIRLDYAWPYLFGRVGSGRLNFAVGYAF